MKIRHLLVMAVFVVAMSLVSVVPTGACIPEGCTPGYWKQEQHRGSWPAPYTPETLVTDAFGGYGPTEMTLIEALKAKGGGENAFLRHAVAALLNGAHPDVAYGKDPAAIKNKVQYAYNTGRFEQAKNVFEERNEFGCPLD